MARRIGLSFGVVSPLVVADGHACSSNREIAVVVITGRSGTGWIAERWVREFPIHHQSLKMCAEHTLRSPLAGQSFPGRRDREGWEWTTS